MAANTIALFPDVIRELRYGATCEEATEEFRKLIKAVEDTGKSGSITITLKVKPNKSGMIEIDDVISAKIPELEHGTSMFFTTPECNLMRDDPKQQKLEFKAVDVKPLEMKEA